VRSYILPDEGDKIISVDYNQQEMRLFAHFEDGELMEEYKRNPRIDAHQMVADLSGLSRKAAKTINFAELYGAGAAVIMEQLDCTEGEARTFKQSYRRALPGVKVLKDSIEATIKKGDPITTIGGRDYYPEPPKMVKGRMRDFNYKMLNYLIQGSAADQSKLAMIDYHGSTQLRTGRLMFPVHDELVITAPAKFAASESKVLAACMQMSYSKSLDVPFLTDIKIGDNYGEF
jgi:DNA polymerase-1